MKTTVVPAQITTVEDKIAGNLNLSQLLLFALPVFGGAGLYAILPPFMASATYKYVVMTMLAFVCCILAIRIRGTVLVFWLVILAKYNKRPRYFVFDKSSTYLRTEPAKKTIVLSEEKVAELESAVAADETLTTSDRALLEHIVSHPDAALKFETTRKGGLRVRITEIE